MMKREIGFVGGGGVDVVDGAVERSRTPAEAEDWTRLKAAETGGTTGKEFASSAVGVADATAVVAGAMVVNSISDSG